MPPSAMMGTPALAAARAHSAMAVICGTPAPVTTRVVQMEPGPIPTFTPSTPSCSRSHAPANVATLPATRSMSGNLLFNFSHRLEHARGMAVGGVHHQQIHLGLHQFRRALQVIARGPQGRAHPQAPLLVFAGVGVLDLLLNILYGNKPTKIIGVIDNQKFFHAVLVQHPLGFFQGRSHGDGDQVLLGHHLFHRQVEAVLEAQVAVGQDAHQLAILGDGHAGNLVLLHDFQRIGDPVLGADGDGIDNHAAFRALHLIHFQRLLGNRHAAMHDADAALLRQGSNT